MAIALSGISDDFESEVDSILEFFHKGAKASLIPFSPCPYTPHSDGCLVSLWDAWGRFVRSLLLACAAGEVVGGGGAKYAPVIPRREEDALRHLEAEKRSGGKSYALAFGSKGEPKWYLVRHSFELGATLQLQNGSTIGSALTASQIHLSASISVSHPGDHLQTLRNYVAHKTAANFAKASRAMPVAVHGDVDSFLRSRTQGGSVVFCDWADALVGLARSATM